MNKQNKIKNQNTLNNNITFIKDVINDIDFFEIEDDISYELEQYHIYANNLEIEDYYFDYE